MDENRGKSIALFLLMGFFFLVTIIYAFVIAPNSNRRTLGSSDLVLDFPVQKRNLRYSGDGIRPFCKEESNSIGIEVTPSSDVYASTDGIVYDVVYNVMTIEVSSSIHIQYYPVSNYAVFKGEYVMKGSPIGRVSGEYLNIRVKDIKNGSYVCPYILLNDFSKAIIEEGMEIMNYDFELCECDSLNF
jgi:hypothetical protein